MLDILSIYKWFYWKKQNKQNVELLKLYEIKILDKKRGTKWKY